MYLLATARLAQLVEHFLDVDGVRGSSPLPRTMSDEAKTRPLVAVGVIVMRDGKILLGERLSESGRGTYQIPGGHLEFGETFAEAAKKEVAEETGLTDVTFEKVVCVNNERTYGKHYVSIGFLAESRSGEPGNPEPTKSRNWKWYDVANLPEPLFAPTKGVLDAWQSGTFFNEVQG